MAPKKTVKRAASAAPATTTAASTRGRRSRSASKVSAPPGSPRRYHGVSKSSNSRSPPAGEGPVEVTTLRATRANTRRGVASPLRSGEDLDKTERAVRLSRRIARHPMTRRMKHAIVETDPELMEDEQVQYQVAKDIIDAEEREAQRQASLQDDTVVQSTEEQPYGDMDDVVMSDAESDNDAHVNPGDDLDYIPSLHEGNDNGGSPQGFTTQTKEEAQETQQTTDAQDIQETRGKGFELISADVPQGTDPQAGEELPAQAEPQIPVIIGGKQLFLTPTQLQQVYELRWKEVELDMARAEDKFLAMQHELNTVKAQRDALLQQQEQRVPQPQQQDRIKTSKERRDKVAEVKQKAAERTIRLLRLKNARLEKQLAAQKLTPADNTPTAPLADDDDALSSSSSLSSSPALSRPRPSGLSRPAPSDLEEPRAPKVSRSAAALARHEQRPSGLFRAELDLIAPLQRDDHVNYVERAMAREKLQASTIRQSIKTKTEYGVALTPVEKLYKAQMVFEREEAELEKAEPRPRKRASRDTERAPTPGSFPTVAVPARQEVNCCPRRNTRLIARANMLPQTHLPDSPRPALGGLGARLLAGASHLSSLTFFGRTRNQPGSSAAPERATPTTVHDRPSNDKTSDRTPERKPSTLKVSAPQTSDDQTQISSPQISGTAFGYDQHATPGEGAPAITHGTELQTPTPNPAGQAIEDERAASRARHHLRWLRPPHASRSAILADTFPDVLTPISERSEASSQPPRSSAGPTAAQTPRHSVRANRRVKRSAETKTQQQEFASAAQRARSSLRRLREEDDKEDAAAGSEAAAPQPGKKRKRVPGVVKHRPSGSFGFDHDEFSHSEGSESPEEGGKEPSKAPAKHAMGNNQEERISCANLQYVHPPAADETVSAELYQEFCALPDSRRLVTRPAGHSVEYWMELQLGLWRADMNISGAEWARRQRRLRAAQLGLPFVEDAQGADTGSATAGGSSAVAASSGEVVSASSAGTCVPLSPESLGRHQAWVDEQISRFGHAAGTGSFGVPDTLDSDDESDPASPAAATQTPARAVTKA
ncbi:MAG: hypothetical protein INR71_03390, partial [Terriglobus roseus]|nr:hypothetical protein [Terriglobus roseus]